MTARKFIVVDTETAPTHDHPAKGVHPEFIRVYDLGWIVTDNDGVIYERRSIVIAETWANKSLMNSSYYANKLPQYEAGLATKEWSMLPMLNAWKLFCDDCRKYNIRDVWAYNARFDMVALNATIEDYSDGFRSFWLPYGLNWRDIMAYAKNGLTKTKRYLAWCKAAGLVTSTGKPRVTAESVYRYISDRSDFAEAHTALADCEIELSILRKCKARHSKVPKPMNKRR